MRTLRIVSCIWLLARSCHAARTLSNTSDCVFVQDSAQVLSLLQSGSPGTLRFCLERCASCLPNWA